MHVLVAVLLPLVLFALIMFRVWLSDGGGGHRIDAAWRRHRQAKRTRGRT